MPSTNQIAKQKKVTDLKGRLGGVEVAIIAHYSGVNVEKMTRLRRELREKKVSFKVEKNSLLTRAIEGTALDGLREHLTGPTALAYTETDPLVLAKALVDFAKVEKALQIRGGVLDGKFIDIKEIGALALIPSREVLLSRLVGSLQSPYAGLVYTLSGVLRKFVYALDAVRRKKEEQGS